MLEAKELTKNYDGQTALRSVSFRVAKGEIFCLLGQNGAGKTTTINIFLGFIDATGGSAWINDLEVKSNQNDTNRLIAYIPELFNSTETFRVWRTWLSSAGLRASDTPKSR